MGRPPEASIAPPEIRELTRYRHKLVKGRTSVKDQVHGVLAKLGIPVTHSDIFGVRAQAWLDELKLPSRMRARSPRCGSWPAGSPPRSGCWSRCSATYWPGMRDTPRSSSYPASTPDLPLPKRQFPLFSIQSH